ncbi:MAG TPA: tetratricopeptide repeat protein [Chloroflexi bacterium]|mgnify:CR=1 FL=1|nr:tetratricopeptide repeat protein [Chloroflexota bacterium]
MKPLAITFLGSFQVSKDDQPITNFGADSARALLVYLAMHAGTQFQRTFLSSLLWPDQPEAEALHALRQALNRLRNAIGDRKADPPFLHITRTAIQFNPHSDYWLDVTAFKDLIATTQQHPHRRLQACRACHRRLTQAAELYRGDLLTSFFLDSHPFEEWLLMEREYLHRQAMDVFYQLAAYHEQRGAFDLAQHYARRQVALEPWREEAHQQLMRALALSGQRSAALTQYDGCRQTLAAELSVAPTATTEALYEQIQAETLLRDPQSPHNLPAQLGPFIGREAALEQIAEQLNRPDCRLLTLLGPSGVGKTRLALQVAREETGAFQDGVYFVPLAAIGSPDALTTALARALGFNFRSGENLQAQLGNYLRKKETLLLLDNFEHLLPGGALIVDLLRHAANLSVLVTSQKRLNAPGECLFNVEALGYPDDALSGDSLGASGEEIHRYSAVHFFVESARRWQPNFSINPANQPHIVRICQLVSGIPLALELAASWLRAYSCQEIAQEVQNDLDFLHVSSPGTPARHHSMRAAFRYAWTLLTTEEQRVLQRLTVFQGSFSREAALQVTDTSSQILAALVDKSMLYRVTYEHPHPVTRYMLHNLVRRYAAEILTGDPDGASKVYEQHCDYYCTLLQALETDLTGSTQRPALDTLNAEIENVRAAWDWAATHGRVSAIRQMLESLTQFYTLRCWFQEGKAVFGQAIESLSQTKPILEHVQHVIHKLVVRRGTFMIHLGRYDEAENLLQDSLKVLQTLDDVPEIISCLNNLSIISNRQGDYAKAKDLLDRALTLAQATPSRRWEADSLSRLGAVYFYLADYARASECYTQTLHIRRELDDRFGESLALGNLGITVYEQDDFQTARAYFEQSLDIIRREIGNREREGWILNNLGMIALDRGEYTDSRDYYRQALHISREIGDLWGESNTLGNLGLVHWSLGDFTKADDYYGEAIQIKQEIGDRRGESLIASFQSLLSCDMGHFTDALNLGRRALAIAEELGASQAQAYALTFVGRAQVELGRLEEAIDAYRQALTIRRETNQHSLAMEIVSGLARVSLLQSDLVQAQAHVDEILNYLEDGSLDGALDPFLVYLTCYQVLKANQRPRAREIIETAHQRLQARAAKISSPELRRSFLTRVTSHVQIVQAHDA